MAPAESGKEELVDLTPKRLKKLRFGLGYASIHSEFHRMPLIVLQGLHKISPSTAYSKYAIVRSSTLPEITRP